MDPDSSNNYYTYALIIFPIIAFVLALTGFILKNKASMKPKDSKEYKQYKNFCIALTVIAIIFFLILVAMFGPGIFF
jgi:hypothetical protein